MNKDLNEVPALESPNGVSNFVDPPTIHHVQIIIGSVCLALCVVAVTIRTLARTVILKTFDWNDG